MELIRREQQRVQTLKPTKYVPDNSSTTARRYQLLQDRAGNFISYHAVGEEMGTPRGLMGASFMCYLNDILDYERDVLCGESNNLVRSLTSDQQVVDAAAWTLEGLRWSMDNHDYDLTDLLIGTIALYLVFWRYNAPKLARYSAISIRDRIPGRPPELEDVAEIIRPVAVTVNKLESYGESYKRVKEKVRRLYWGCTCYNPDTSPEGHEAWKLLAQAFDEGGNDDIEERLMVAVVALNNGANDGDLRCECGMDLLLYESFVRFLDPDTGLVARLHYRSGNIELGNTITE
ncbi:hypothetical protein HRG_000776 [Hirsutella rhossiliensis]|uniref:Uncharacterized protein n=1 Tax=Hirsutella rhossiliensis TaxID=111463 RepID=A0A9P8SN90_9HYPO|nr:uncharacterized protein HRG_00776 [Hirsutella rhossiliensis]KAH0968134.1 hypothetical protein HRG_00776 [Hirsutella rhossiliensis]